MPPANIAKSPVEAGSKIDLSGSRRTSEKSSPIDTDPICTYPTRAYDGNAIDKSANDLLGYTSPSQDEHTTEKLQIANDAVTPGQTSWGPWFHSQLCRWVQKERKLDSFAETVEGVLKFSAIATAAFMIHFLVQGSGHFNTSWFLHLVLTIGENLLLAADLVILTSTLTSRIARSLNELIKGPKWSPTLASLIIILLIIVVASSLVPLAPQFEGLGTGSPQSGPGREVSCIRSNVVLVYVVHAHRHPLIRGIYTEFSALPTGGSLRRAAPARDVTTAHASKT